MTVDTPLTFLIFPIHFYDIRPLPPGLNPRRPQPQPPISPDKARKGVIYPLKTGIYALVGIYERTFTRLISKQRGKIRSN